jgi:TatD DNase family protein
MMVKEKFDVPLSAAELDAAGIIVEQAALHDVSTIINVGTSLIESQNCVALAQKYASIYATVGIHPNDCTKTWRNDFKLIEKMAKNKDENKIVGIGECGIDMHYPDFNLDRQNDAFKAHVELALEHDLALVIHSRDAYDETLSVLEEFKHDIKRATIHCFSYDRAFAHHVTAMQFFIGIDGPITYPKNTELREVVQTIGLDYIVLETDAPFLPPQNFRGKPNNPLHIQTIAQYIAEFSHTTLDEVARKTTYNARKLFNLF